MKFRSNLTLEKCREIGKFHPDLSVCRGGQRGVSMDIGYTTLSGKFSLRSAALIIRDNCLLVARNDKYDCYYTVGGGIWENEPSDKAVVRELYEETGCHFEVDRLIFSNFPHQKWDSHLEKSIL